MPTPVRAREYWPLAAAIALLCVLLLVLGRASLRAAGGHVVYALDDSYIQMAIAKNLAAHGVWGVTRHEFSGAGSSLLWPLLLAAAHRLAGMDVRTPFYLNVACALLLLGLSSAVMRRHAADRGLQAVALALIVFASPLAVLALIGMEHTLVSVAALLLAVAAARLCSAPTNRERRIALGLTVAAAPLAVAARYDAAAVLGAVLLLLLFQRKWRIASAVALAGAAPAAVYAAVAWQHGWPALPTSILLKHRFQQVDPFTWHGAANLAGGGALTVLVNEPALFALVLLALALIASTAGLESPIARESTYLLIVFVVAVLGHVQFGRTGWLYRYEAHLVVLGIVANAAALGPQIPRWARPNGALQWTAAGTLAVLLLHPLLLRGFQASRDVVTETSDIFLHEYQLGQFFGRHPPEGALLVGDMGAVAYFSDVPIVDAGGLATLELYPQVRAATYDGELVRRVAERRGARVSVTGNPGRGAAAWICVGAWRARPERRSAPAFFFAADRAVASRLERSLREFAAGDLDGAVELILADAMPERCGE